MNRPGCPIESALSGVEVIERRGNLPVEVEGITQDSRRIKPGWIFAARVGEKVSGLDYVKRAAQAGATLVVTDAALPPDMPLPAIRVEDFRFALVALSKAIYHDPSRRLKLIGITGTNGKTTTTYLLRGVVQASGAKCGLMGTVGYDDGSQSVEAPLTTPDIDCVDDLLANMVDSGCGWAVMEVSSHALAQGRVAGLKFIGAGFTNLSRDHLDYHNTFEDYAAAKSRLFEMVDSGGVAVGNFADPWCSRILEGARGRKITFASSGAGADLAVQMQEHTIAGGIYKIMIRQDSYLLSALSRHKEPEVERFGDGSVGFQVRTPLVGVYHGENIALAAGLALGLGLGIADVQEGISAVRSVPGRMEAVDAAQPFAVFVDYSHTPDALRRALDSLRPLCKGRLLVVFGCGGNRDRTKRPEMGRIAAERADTVYVTSDNPRFEDPEGIISEVMSGVPSGVKGRVQADVDRESAITDALKAARAGDVVLIAGKGHENYQETNGVRRPFDDRLVAREALGALDRIPVG